MEEITRERIFKIRRNLTDAGCEAAFIEEFLELEKGKKRREQYCLLSRHKASLLEELHQNQYKINCLDYLVYVMEKEEKEEHNNGRKIKTDRRMG